MVSSPSPARQPTSSLLSSLTRRYKYGQTFTDCSNRCESTWSHMDGLELAHDACQCHQHICSLIDFLAAVPVGPKQFLLTQCLGAGWVWAQTNQPPQPREPISSSRRAKLQQKGLLHVAACWTKVRFWFCVYRLECAVVVLIPKWCYQEQKHIQPVVGDQSRA